MKVKLYTDDKPAYKNQSDTHKYIDAYLKDRMVVIKPKTIVIKAPRQISGKSQFGINELVRFSLRRSKCFNGYLAPTNSQAKEAFIKINNSLFDLIKASNATNLEIIFNNDSRIKFFSAESKSNLRGYTITDLLVVDEAAFISNEVWYTFVSAWAIVKMPLVIMISTPWFQEGFFWEYYNKGLDDNIENITTFDWSNEYPDMFERNREYLDSIKDTMPYKKYNTEYLANWLTLDDSTVFKNVTANIITYKPTYNDLYMGIDWSTGSGKDYTSITIVNELGEVVNQFNFNELSPVDQVSKVKEIITEYKPKKIQADATSIGIIYKDLLKGINIIWTSFTNERKQKWVDQLAVAFENNLIKIPNNKDLINELNYYEAEKTATGKITYNASKGNTDDRITSLYLAWDLYINRNKGTGIRIIG